VIEPEVEGLQQKNCLQNAKQNYIPIKIKNRINPKLLLQIVFVSTKEKYSYLIFLTLTCYMKIISFLIQAKKNKEKEKTVTSTTPKSVGEYNSKITN
jgi:hypothetical protein